MAVEKERTFHQEIAANFAERKIANLAKSVVEGTTNKEELKAWTDAANETLKGNYGKLAVLVACESFGNKSGQELSLNTNPETVNWDLLALAAELGKDRR